MDSEASTNKASNRRGNIADDSNLVLDVLISVSRELLRRGREVFCLWLSTVSTGVLEPSAD